MTREARWRIVDGLLGAALERPPHERDTFLRQACGEDEALRLEVQSLLAHHDEASGFLDAPAGALLPRAADGAARGGRAALEGRTLGAYQVIRCIGVGGMGEVYEAHDQRLGRDVAIKVMSPALVADAERRARFEREARAIATLSHPHICTLHDIGAEPSPGGSPPMLYLVMELLRGDTLTVRLRHGPLPLEEALEIGAQIADALNAAHRQGVIHRDLKPGNVMLVSPSGRSRAATVKLLDFGLAKLTTAAADPSPPSIAPADEPGTAPATLLGTVPYMAPEQIDGRPTDARTDLWALGAILYEMLTGERAFAGDNAVTLLGSILHTDPPPPSTRQPSTPPELDRLVRRCLAKDPDERWASAHDIADELRWIRQRLGAAPATVRPAGSVRRLMVPIAWAGVLISAVVWLLRPGPAHEPLAHLSLEVRPAEELNGGVMAVLPLTPGGSRQALRWTPDGTALVFAGRVGGVQQLYLRRLDSTEASPIAGTEGAQSPAVSPDGRWVAFWANRAIRKVPLEGGPVIDLASDMFMPPSGLAWTAEGGVMFGGEGTPIREAGGGTVRAITALGDTEFTHALPSVLPDAQTVLVTVRRRSRSWGDEEIVAFNRSTGTRKVLLRDAADARYVSTGHLVFLRRGVLLGIPFDAERLEIRGHEVPLLESVAQALTGGGSPDLTGAGQFDVSSTGTLAWVSGSAVRHPEAALVTVDHQGIVSRLKAPVRSYAPGVRVFQDAEGGERLAVSIQALTEMGLWLFDPTRRALTPLIRDGEANWPLWWPDGERLAFAWLKDGRYSLATLPVDGSGRPEVLAPPASPSSFTPDGRHLAVFAGGGSAANVTIVTMGDGGVEVSAWMETPEFDMGPVFSPDGRWLAYASTVGKGSQVYLRPYPGPGPRYQLSIDGGLSPAWHPDGRTLFYLTPRDDQHRQRMMAVGVEPGSPPRLGTPRQLFEFTNRELWLSCIPVRCFDVSSDGQRFYAVQPLETLPAPPVTHINVILNWFGALQQKVPSAAR